MFMDIKTHNSESRGQSLAIHRDSLSQFTHMTKLNGRIMGKHFRQDNDYETVRENDIFYGSHPNRVLCCDT